MLINDVSAKILQHREQISRSIEQVLNSGWVVLGPKVTEFETNFAQYIGCNFCISVANGTDAIEFGLKALGVTSKHTVATIANAGMYTTTAVMAIGASLYFMDVDANTHNTNLFEVKKAISSGANAVVITHLYGLAVAEIPEIAYYCKQHNVVLLEDCAQAHGAKIANQTVGSFGDAASFSFYPTKNLGALGDGGAVTCNHPEIAKHVKQLRQYGWTNKYHVSLAGARNSRLDEIQAAILSVFLPSLDDNNIKRRQIAIAYAKGINNPYLILPKLEQENNVVHLYVVKSKLRNSLKQHLKNLDIASDVHYPIPDHKQVILSKAYDGISLPTTEQLANEVLTLPCYPEMTPEQINLVVESVNSWKP